MIAASKNSFDLPKNTVHLWHVSFDDPADNLEGLMDLLSLEEREKASRFKFERHKTQSIISRGVLRCLLGKYLQMKPLDLQFDYTEYGKPFLRDATGIRFNLSHSGQRAVFAFVQEAEIGVDIEKIKNNFDVLDIARHFFSSDELQALEVLPVAQRPVGFYRCWTRKESFIKAKGSGLSFPLTSFSVSLDVEHAQLLRTDWDASERQEWQLATFRPSEEYQAALSVRGNIDSLVERDWNQSYI